MGGFMKKIRVDRVLIVCFVFVIVLVIMVYLFLNRSHYYEYQDDITTYVGVYRQDEKIYTFDLKAFQKDNHYYVSLNDFYNVMIVIDKNTHVYLHESKHMLVYVLKNKTYYFNYGQDKIVYDDECLDMEDYHSHIYISRKNVYINVFFIEKLFFNNKKSIKFENKNAIIE